MGNNKHTLNMSYMNYNYIINFYIEATYIQKLKMLHTLISLYRVELQSVNVDLDKGIILFEPVLISHKLLSDIYSLGLIEKCFVQNNDSIENECKSITYEVFDFFDQMFCEHLLEDVILDKDAIIEKIRIFLDEIEQLILNSSNTYIKYNHETV